MTVSTHAVRFTQRIYTLSQSVFTTTENDRRQGLFEQLVCHVNDKLCVSLRPLR